MTNTIFCIDLKSFYASVECAKRNLDPFTTPLVVADVERGKGSVVLAVTPYMKSLGCPSRCQIIDIPKIKNIIYAKPSMSDYIDIAVKIIEIYLDFVAEEDLHIYSIDEAFLDISPYKKIYHEKPEELAKKILKAIYEATKIIATCGIGENLFMAKSALDNDAKYNAANNYVSLWTRKDINEKLWPLNVIDMWGIGRNLAKRLNKLGIYTVGDLANYDVALLEKEFGIIGLEMHNHSLGFDSSRIQDKILFAKNKSFGLGQTLFSDYKRKEFLIVLKEMVEELCMRLRKENKLGSVISLTLKFSFAEKNAKFHHQIKLAQSTNDDATIYENLLFLFNKYYNNELIRGLYISISNLSLPEFENLNLFGCEKKTEQNRKLNACLDNIKKKYNNTIIMKASSLLEGSTFNLRTKLIGGHNAK